MKQLGTYFKLLKILETVLSIIGMLVAYLPHNYKHGSDFSTMFNRMLSGVKWAQCWHMPTYYHMVQTHRSALFNHDKAAWHWQTHHWGEMLGINVKRKLRNTLCHPGWQGHATLKIHLGMMAHINTLTIRHNCIQHTCNIKYGLNQCTTKPVQCDHWGDWAKVVSSGRWSD